MERPSLHRLESYLLRHTYVAFLSIRDSRCCQWIHDEEIVLEVELQATTIQVGGSNQ